MRFINIKAMKSSSEKMYITEINYFQYLLFIKNKSSLSDYYMNYVRSGYGKAYALTENENIISYAVFFEESGNWKLVYIETDQSKRRMGYASRLIRKYLELSGKNLIVVVNDKTEHSEALQNCMNKLGFFTYDSGAVYSVDVNARFWEKMKNLKLQKIKEFLLRNNSECVSFLEMDNSIKEQLLNSQATEFKNIMNPKHFFDVPCSGLNKNLSYVMTSGGKLIAYTIISIPFPGTVCVEQIAESEKTLKSGNIIVPLCSSLEAIKQIPDINKIKFTVNSNNHRSLNFIRSFFNDEELEITRNIGFVNSLDIVKS